MTLCLLSGIFYVGLVFMLFGWALKTFFKKDRLAYMTGIVTFLVGGLAVAPYMYLKGIAVVAVVLCMAVAGTSYVDYRQYKRLHPSS